MGRVEMTCLGLECGVGGGSSSAVSNDVGRDESIFFPKAAEDSCCSQSVSTTDSSDGNHNNSIRDCIVTEISVDEVRISVEAMKRDCRICMLCLDLESEIAIELGCSCKNELAAVHQHCAEQWFRSKGNNVCEICNSIARNVVVPSDTEWRQQTSHVNTSTTNAVSVPVYEVDASSTNTFLFPVSSTNAVSVTTNAILVPVSQRNVVAVPESSTWNAALGLICGSVLVLLIFLIIVTTPDHQAPKN